MSFETKKLLTRRTVEDTKISKGNVNKNIIETVAIHGSWRKS